VFNTIIARTFFQTMPDSLIESAKLDGVGEVQILLRIVIPLSMPIVAVLILYYAVAAWNSFFPAMLYLKDAELHPMQLYLRRVLIQNTEDIGADMKDAVNKSFISMQLKYTVIVISTLPMLVVYPFLQKYFVKGVMIGAIKE
jgi:putative aldouronate transport system permease protein